MIKARASGSKVYLYFMKKGRQARHRIPRNSCFNCILLTYDQGSYCSLMIKGLSKNQMQSNKLHFTVDKYICISHKRVFFNSIMQNE